MRGFISISRSARLVGVKRGTIQRQVQDGILHSFEGEIALSELIQAYPDLKLSDDSMLERVSGIMRRVGYQRPDDQYSMPDLVAVQSRLRETARELAVSRVERDHLLGVLVRLEAKLTDLQDIAEIDLLVDWLNAAKTQNIEPHETYVSLLSGDLMLSVMTAHVRLMPGGRDYFVEGGDSLLQAGLRAGIAMGYGCNNGACGECKAKLVQGSVKKTHAHDYSLTPQEKADNIILTCCNAPLTDTTLEMVVALDPTELPKQRINTKVRKISPANERVSILSLRPSRRHRMRFFAGQSVILRNSDGETIELPVASCPCDEKTMEFHLYSADSGDESPQPNFLRSLKVGAKVEIAGPNGHFVVDESSARSMLFIASSTGFSAAASMLEHAFALNNAEQIHLFHIAGESGHYAHNLCRSWHDALDEFHYRPLTDEDLEPALRQFFSTETPGDYDYYLSTNQSIRETISKILTSAEVPKCQIFSSPDQPQTG